MQAGEIKVKKFQEVSEMQEERVQKAITAIFFPQFFPGEISFLRKKNVYKHLLYARHSIRCFHVISFISDNPVEEILLPFSNDRN